jgi:amino-acid N-acetyltransferase
LAEARLRPALREDFAQVYLLMTSASEFFVRLGFEVIARESAPPEMKVSPEFAGICPASALCLVKMFR